MFKKGDLVRMGPGSSYVYTQVGSIGIIVDPGYHGSDVAWIYLTGDQHWEYCVPGEEFHVSSGYLQPITPTELSEDLRLKCVEAKIRMAL